MAGITSKNFSAADERRTPDKTTAEIVGLGDVTAARFTLQPGWRWSECIKPVAGTDFCQARHVGAVVSGQMHVVHTDGTEADMVSGDAYVLEPGHDAWVTSDEPFVGFEFDTATAQSYARPGS